ncbi:MAG: endolytic transglycosylase MltG [Chitinispirillia bacterium]|nr:endolytic transglycosylase MltG [Chitinispirillia bacterium]
MTLRSLFLPVYRLLFTAVILLLAAAGYCLYSILWVARVIKKLIIVCFLLLLCVVGLGAYAYYYTMMPMGESAETVQITIERGTSARAVADSLEAHGIVRSADALFYYLRFSGISAKIQSGLFTFVKGEGALSASEKLLKSQTIDQQIFIKEGFTVEQTASRFAAEMGIDSAEFVRLCYDAEFIKSTGINANSLEGYLFPDTYRFSGKCDAALILRRMTARFNEVWATVAGDSAIMAKYNVHQIITLASIVEKEATLPSERGKIAGVFHNRLRLGWPLGADPTVRYIFRKFDGPLYRSELNVDSPYNTRRFKGLPPGPICSPGLGAIAASAKPDTTKAMFFVAKWDGSGAHDFSVTNAEHDRKKYEIRRQNELRLKKKGSQ